MFAPLRWIFICQRVCQVRNIKRYQNDQYFRILSPKYEGDARIEKNALNNYVHLAACLHHSGESSEFSSVRCEKLNSSKLFHISNFFKMEALVVQEQRRHRKCEKKILTNMPIYRNCFFFFGFSFYFEPHTWIFLLTLNLRIDFMNQGFDALKHCVAAINQSFNTIKHRVYAMDQGFNAKASGIWRGVAF